MERHVRKEGLPTTGFTGDELMVIEEAVRRATLRPCNAGVDGGFIAEAVLAEARRGTRTLFGLVKGATLTVAALG